MLFRSISRLHLCNNGPILQRRIIIADAVNGLISCFAKPMQSVAPESTRNESKMSRPNCGLLFDIHIPQNLEGFRDWVKLGYR